MCKRNALVKRLRTLEEAFMNDYVALYQQINTKILKPYERVFKKKNDRLIKKFPAKDNKIRDGINFDKQYFLNRYARIWKSLKKKDIKTLDLRDVHEAMIKAYGSAARVLHVYVNALTKDCMSLSNNDIYRRFIWDLKTSKKSFKRNIAQITLGYYMNSQIYKDLESSLNGIEADFVNDGFKPITGVKKPVVPDVP